MVWGLGGTKVSDASMPGLAKVITCPMGHSCIKAEQAFSCLPPTPSRSGTLRKMSTRMLGPKSVRMKSGYISAVFIVLFEPNASSFGALMVHVFVAWASILCC